MSLLIINNTENTKLCHTCNLYKTINNFYKDSGKKDGLQTQCIDCYNFRRSVKYSEAPHRFNSYEPTERKFCDVCDCELRAINYNKHLIGTRHQTKVKQLLNKIKNIDKEKKQILDQKAS